MLFLADENFPGEAVEALRERGHDAAWVHADAPGTADREVLGRAQREERVVITLDKDFGELAFRFGLPSSSGVILFRVRASSPKEFVQTAIRALESRQGRAHLGGGQARRKVDSDHQISSLTCPGIPVKLQMVDYACSQIPNPA